MKTLKDLFLEELADIYDAEHQTVEALPKMANAATCDKLRKAIETHLEETEGHVVKLERVFQYFGEEPEGKTCKATGGLLVEADELAVEFKGSPAINAALISAAQKLEHHEIASYGCLHAWAGMLGYEDAAELLQEILDEETAANATFTGLARGGVNEEALGESDGSGSEDGDDQAEAPKRGLRPSSTAPDRAGSISR
jgi:ferritin-like metal-binding protein YciE